MLTMTWSKHRIKSQEDLINMIRTFKQLKPEYGSYDTETNGLHIIKCTPFLLAFGFVNVEHKQGHTYTLLLKENPKLTRTTIYALIKLFKKLKKVVGHNVKFDMHMMTNIGYPEIFSENSTDSMIYIRLAHDALSKKEGGIPDALKDYAQQYITSNAKDHEKLIKAEISRRESLRTVELKRRLNKIPLIEEYKLTGRERSWTKAIVEELVKDKVLGLEGLDPRVRVIVQQWLDETENPDDYSKLPIEIVEPYAHYDVIYTLEIFLQTKEVALARGQKNTIELEEKLIMPLYRMERVGFRLDVDYTLSVKERVRTYILESRKILERLAGRPVKTGQHKVMKQIFAERFNLHLASTGQDVLAGLEVDDPKAQEFIDILTELRTLEKWYSTYIIRFLEDLSDGRVYTSIKQTGAASGRVSSDFQQFPKKPILDRDGNELFHPRKMVIPTGGKYKKMFFIDYSQIELRIQAIYTLMVNHGDVNLCRAYMPYKCYTIRKGENILFDNKNLKHIKNFSNFKWYLLEEPETEWHPTDLHALTALSAFPNLKSTDEEFSSYRSIGKRVNFACNYGASAYKLHTAMKFDMPTANALYNAYTSNFPGIIQYRKMVQRLINRDGYMENLYGRRYYGISGHLAGNYAVQGSAADFLKQKIIEVDAFLKDYKTRFQMNIHDELSFEYHEDDPEELLFMIQAIMEDLPGTLVPIVADLEITETNWAEKRKYERAS